MEPLLNYMEDGVGMVISAPTGPGDRTNLTAARRRRQQSRYQTREMHAKELTSMKDRRAIIRDLVEAVDHRKLGSGFSPKISRASFERPIPGGHQAYWFYHRVSTAKPEGRAVIIEPGIGIEFKKISRLVRFLEDPERVDAASQQHYLINANIAFLKPATKGFQSFEIRTSDDVQTVKPTLEQDIRGFVEPIFTRFQCLEDFVAPEDCSAELRGMLRRDLLSRIGVAYFTRGREAAAAIVGEQPSHFYGTGGRAGKAGAELVVSRILEYEP